MTIKRCPHCERDRDTRVLPPDWSGTALRVFTADRDIHFRMRRVECSKCSLEWWTVEMDYDTALKLVTARVDLRWLTKKIDLQEEHYFIEGVKIYIQEV